MSNNQCQPRLPIPGHTASNPLFSAARPKQLPSEQKHVYSLPISDASNLAQFLLEQQGQMLEKHDANGVKASDTISPPTIAPLSSRQGESEKILLGFHNLGHFLDWLDAKQAKQEQSHA